MAESDRKQAEFVLKDRRRPLRISVRAIYPGQGDQARFYRSIDISVSGISLETGFPAEPGSETLLEFLLPDATEPLKVRGRTVRVIPRPGPAAKEPAGGFAVRFVDLDAAVQETIRRFVEWRPGDKKKPSP